MQHWKDTVHPIAIRQYRVIKMQHSGYKTLHHLIHTTRANTN